MNKFICHKCEKDFVNADVSNEFQICPICNSNNNVAYNGDEIGTEVK